MFSLFSPQSTPMPVNRNFHPNIQGPIDHRYLCSFQLIQRAQRHGNQHPKTMELADYWLLVRYMDGLVQDWKIKSIVLAVI